MKHVLIALLCLFSSAASAATTLKIATLVPDGSNWMKEMKAGAAQVAKLTEQRVKIKFYPGGVMGNDKTVFRKIRIGQLHGGAFTGGEAAQIYPDAQIYSLPFLFKNYAEVDQIRKAFDAELIEGFDKAGWLAVGVSEGGFSYLMTQTAVASASDLQGKKVWVPEGDKLALTAFQKAGVQPVTLPIPDVYTGLQTKLIDTVISSPSGAIALQWHTGARYLTEVPLNYLVGTMVISHKALRKVSKADQDIIRQEMGKAFATLDVVNRKDNAGAKQAFTSLGIESVQPAAADITAWNKIAAESLKELRNQGLYTPELLDRIQAQLKVLRQ